MSSYNDQFYEYNLKSSGSSADIVFPLICEKFSPRSIVDFGCGRGTWLNAAHKRGVKELVGLDGAWNKDKQINSEIKFLELKDHKQVEDKKYDLAISLEVFEHLDLQFCSDLIDTMTACSDIIIFSAAFVAQRGTEHINEQYPSFWANQFIKRGFKAYDMFRPQLWGKQNVDYCYQQNMFLYVSEECTQYDNVLRDFQISNIAFMDTMHPGIYLNRSGRDSIKDFYQNILRVMRRRVYK